VGDIDFVREATSGQVVWVEGTAGTPVLRIAPIDVGVALAEHLWAERDGESVTAVLTSATIPGGLGARLGLEAGSFDELDVGSPFDFADHALLYCAAHRPDPRSAQQAAAMPDVVVALLEAAGG